jgi:hypothetical protein
LPARAPISRRRRLAYAAVVVLAFFGLAELGARTVGRGQLHRSTSPPPERQDGAPNLPGNPYLLWEMVPGNRQEMEVTAYINRFGLRGPEWELEKPADVRRIMAVGDSSVYGFGVYDEDVFTAQLDARAGDEVQVINSAVPGYSSYQAVNLLKIRSLALDPDVLIIGTLWSDNNFDTMIDREMMAAYGTFGNRSARRLRAFLDLSAAFRVADYLLRVKVKEPDSQKVGWMEGRPEGGRARRVEINDYARNLETMAELVHEIGGEVMFLMLANREDLGPVSAHGPAAWDPYRDVMRDAAARHGAPLVDIPAIFHASGVSADELFIDAMHPSARGHALLADAVEAALLERRWPDGMALEVDPRGGALPQFTDEFAPSDAETTAAAEDRLPRINGTVSVPEYSGGSIQIDVFDASEERVVGTTRLTAPGSFGLELDPPPRAVRFVVYLDLAADGPGAGDVRFTWTRGALAIPPSGDVEGLVLDTTAGDVVRSVATP